MRDKEAVCEKKKKEKKKEPDKEKLRAGGRTEEKQS